MLKTARAWLDTMPIDDPLRRRQALLLQIMLLGLSAMLIALALVVWWSELPDVHVPLLLLLMQFGILQGALWMLRTGHFRPAVLVAALGLCLPPGFIYLNAGVVSGASLAPVFLLPILLVGLTLGRRALFAIGGLVITMVIGTAALQPVAPALIGTHPLSPNPEPIVGSFVLITFVVCVIVNSYRTTLLNTIDEATARERELQSLRNSLELTVHERTAELQAIVDQLQTTQATVRELGAPVLPVLPGVLVAPLIGAIDTARAEDLSAAVLAAIDRTDAKRLILDITGVPVVDTHVTMALLQMAQAARLLGAETLLVGVRAEVAQMIVTLGVDLHALQIYPNLQEAVMHLSAAPVVHRSHIQADYARFTS